MNHRQMNDTLEDVIKQFVTFLDMSGTLQQLTEEYCDKAQNQPSLQTMFQETEKLLDDLISSDETNTIKIEMQETILKTIHTKTQDTDTINEQVQTSSSFKTCQDLCEIQQSISKKLYKEYASVCEDKVSEILCQLDRDNIRDFIYKVTRTL